MTRKISVIGITDLGPDSLTPEARARVDEAALLCGGERHLAFFPHHPAERFVIKANVGDLVARLREETRPAVVLASGDPNCYGIGPLLAQQLGHDRVEILPNVSAVQLAFARLGLSWHDAVVLSAHGRPLDGVLPAALFAEKVVLLTDETNTPSAVARALLDAGVERARVDVFEHLGGARERHVAGTLRDVVGQTFAPLNLMVVRHDGRPRSWPLGLPEEAFAHREGMITKAEVRAVSLSKLRLHERAILWDVGAGCGSVAVEASGLVRRGRVYAVERDPEQRAYLAANRRRFGAGNVAVVDGEAPEALADLPDPDAVFVGGSGGRLPEIVRCAVERLKAGGRVVVNLATVEHVSQTLELGRALACDVEVVQIGVARSVATAGLTRLAALNPVFVVALWRKADHPSPGARHRTSATPSSAPLRSGAGPER